MVSVFRHFRIFSEKLEIPGVYRFGQMLDLVTRIIHIVFGANFIACRTEKVHQSGTVSCASGVTDMERSCRIGRYILDENFIFMTTGKISVGFSFGKYFLQFAVHCSFGKEEIDKSCSRNIRMGYERGVHIFHNGFGNHARCFAGRSCPLHRRICGIVAEFL